MYILVCPVKLRLVCVFVIVFVGFLWVVFSFFTCNEASLFSCCVFCFCVAVSEHGRDSHYLTCL